jgi:hypothetical protein
MDNYRHHLKSRRYHRRAEPESKCYLSAIVVKEIGLYWLVDSSYSYPEDTWFSVRKHLKIN